MPWLVGVLTDTLVLAVFVHLLLAFPSGRLEGVPERLVVGAGYVVATLLQLPPLLFGLEYNCAGTACPRNLLRIAREPDVAASFSTAQTLAELAVIAVRARARGRSAGARPARAQRRGLEPVLGLGAAIAALGAVSFARAGGRCRRRGEQGRPAPVPVRARAAPASPSSPAWCAAASSAPPRSRACSTGSRGDAGALQVRDALRDALGDPSLTIAYRLPERGGHVDPEGRPLALPPPGGDRVATEIGHARAGR